MPPADPPVPTSPGNEAALGADLTNRLAASAAGDDDPAFGAAARRVRHRVLSRIAEDQRGHHHTVQSADGDWQPFGDGLSMKVLHESDGVLSYLVRLAPGAALPAHRHPIDEECVVLEGAVRLGDLVVGAGGYHLGRRGVPHAPIDSPSGALIFLRGATPELAHLI